MKQSFFIVSFFLSVTLLRAQVWHVSANGDDNADGKTVRTAFRSLQKAADVVNAGDMVYVGNGNYSNEEKGHNSAVLSVTRSGTKEKWITWKPEPGAHPEIHPGGWAGIQFSGSYHVLDGFTVIGANDSLSLVDADVDAKKITPDPKYNTNGILVQGRYNDAQHKPHHIIIRNCTVAKCPGGGITVLEGDYISIEDCLVYNNAWYMRYGGSGITTLNNWAFDDAPGYHITVQRNLVWNNKSLVLYPQTGKQTDGNGILLDVTDKKRSGPINPNNDAIIQGNNQNNDSAKLVRPEWKGRALIANNVCAFNGGSGIHTFRTSHVDIINNTTYWNGQVVNYEELFPNVSDDIVIMNNIMVPRPGGRVTSNNKSTNVKWDYNLYSKPQNIFRGPHDIVADPGCIDIQLDFFKSNYRLKKGSAAIDSGCDEVPQPTDVTGAPRPKGKGRDRGAYEQ